MSNQRKGTSSIVKLRQRKRKRRAEHKRLGTMTTQAHREAHTRAERSRDLERSASSAAIAEMQRGFNND